MIEYTATDIEQMKSALVIAMDYLHDYKSEAETSAKLQDTFDLLDELLVKGLLKESN